MTSACEIITVKCPQCGKVYEDWYRPSVNLMIDDFDEDYLEKCSSATCPECGHKINIGMLVVDKEGTFVLHE